MTEHLNVLIIGAGLSGIGAAHHIREAFPNRTYAVFEARDAIGGTWDLFRYPGVRSDSDMQTLGYRFRPWTDAKAIADGPSILRYIRDTAAAGGIDKHIRYDHPVTRATWDSSTARWTIEAEHGGEIVTVTCDFLYCCSGYYRYGQGHAPEFDGVDDFDGRIVHPQAWPEDLDYTGKNVVVIGSGATAVTLVPAMADRAAHVTMLQRTPTYILSQPSQDAFANALRKIVGNRISYGITRWKNVLRDTLVYQLCQRYPDTMRKFIRGLTIKELPEGFDVDTHFKPPYNPWDQRLCLVPDSDLFKAIGSGDASVVTDRIDRLTAKGILLESGAELPADVVVTATGLKLLAFGGIQFTVDGTPVDIGSTLSYKGMLLGGIPNFAFTVGYTNASWTLKADLVSEYVCRMLRYLDEHDYGTFVPQPEPGIEGAPLLNFSAGYVLRALDEFPKAGTRAPWRLGMNYAQDLLTLRHGRINDKAMHFTKKLSDRNTDGAEALPA
ncbi:flavin-containing monooxygenase [Nocardia pseudovaccinii]|uniref:flavin-containing monooxygenase n=1 Tax=Nocardia pseudovaccinii TaxID=189540 RepID=UPI0007A44F1E|nr:NAD(P)/FAD-dependent oxidoreductase [Nocardia pseudovaccinii]